jgi:hypothetical protein
MQGATNNNYYAYVHSRGGSSSLADKTFYPLTITGSTVTKGADITPPVIASYDI